MNKIIKDIVEKNKGNRFFIEAFWDEIYKSTRGRGHLKTVIDLGAYAGEFSMYIYDKADQIYAVEPLNAPYSRLLDNIKELPKIKAFRNIISDVNGYKYICGNDDGGAHIQEQPESETSEKVESKTLATFMKDNGIEEVDVLKIDVESAEPLIFGAEDFKDVAHKIKFIIGEHGAGLQNILEPLGFKWKDGFTAWR